MAIKSNPCKKCGSLFHTAAFCLKSARTPIRKPSKTLKVKKAPVKKITHKKAKENAWKAFSIYIRTRDCLLTTGTTQQGKCITCNVRGDRNPLVDFNKSQAGHAIGGRSNAILFHEEIVNLQCGYCNQKPPIGLGGDYGNYAIALIERYGLDHYKYLQSLKGKELQYKTYELVEIEQKYKDKTLELLT